MQHSYFVSFPSHLQEKESSSTLCYVYKKGFLKFDHTRRAAQASQRLQAGQQAGQPMLTTQLQGDYCHFVDVSWSKCWPSWDRLIVVMLGRMWGWQEVQPQAKSHPDPPYGRGEQSKPGYCHHRKANRHPACFSRKEQEFLSNPLWAGKWCPVCQKPPGQSWSEWRGLAIGSKMQPCSSSALCSLHS